MAKTFKVKLLTLNSVIFDDEVTKVFTTTSKGSIELLRDHASIIMSTVPCITTIVDKDDNKIELFTAKGIISMINNELVFCLDAAEKAEEVDIERAMASKERAEGRIQDPSKYDLKRAKASLERAIARIRIKENSMK